LSTGSGCASRQPTSKRRRAGACCEAATPGLSISVIVFKKSGATVLKDLLGREVDVVTEKGGLHWYIRDRVCRGTVPL